MPNAAQTSAKRSRPARGIERCPVKRRTADGPGLASDVSEDGDRVGAAKRRRIAISLMIGGILAGIIVGELTGSNWLALLGLAVSLWGYQMFSSAD